MIPETGPFKVACDDGIERTFHRSGIYSRTGFVYNSHRRVYGKVTETYQPLRGYVNVFAAEGANAHLVARPETAEAV
jgi:hypothetical protein